MYICLTVALAVPPVTNVTGEPAIVFPVAATAIVTALLPLKSLYLTVKVYVLIFHFANNVKFAFVAYEAPFA